ncbi:MAG: ABC transporter permease [Actinobacteria bacterium]|nr:ABC transporter permease [Actinomycetota bacterium]
MLLAVIAAIAVPAMIKTGKVTRDVGFTGATPASLPATVIDQGKAVDVTVRPHYYGGVAAGEQAMRDRNVNVLVVDARRLAWMGKPDERLRAIVTGSIQIVIVKQRAAAAGVNPGKLQAVMAPVPVQNQELGIVTGRSADNEAAAAVMSVLLLMAIIVYGNLVLTGVAEEKSSRVVEVLLARMPARTLLAGKVAGIGLLGLAQFAVTALAALIAALAVDAVDIPAVSGGVLAWVVVWFVLGYAIYAMAYGALGSLASRAEDAASVAGPVSYVLIVAYWASYIAVANSPDGAWSKLVSLLPATAPFAMPGRIALGAVAWWEPVVAAALAVAAIGVLAVLAGRVYTGAILHTGPTLKLRDAWRSSTTPGPGRTKAGARTTKALLHEARAIPGEGTTMTTPDLTNHRLLVTVLTGIGVALGVTVAVLTSDVIMGVIAGAVFIAVTTMMIRLWTGHSGPPIAHH